MTVALALASALAYGLSDFLGGVLSRRTSVWQVAAVSQVCALVAVTAAALFFAGHPSGSDLAWGAVSGMGSGVGTAFLYRGLSRGRMSVVAPVSAVGAAVLPVAVGVLNAERPGPLAWIGIAAALPAIWLVSTGEGDLSTGGEHVAKATTGLLDGVLAGVGFGFLFAALGQVGADAGLAPLAWGQLVSAVVVVALALALRQRWLPRSRAAWRAAWVGVLSGVATVLFQLATQSGLLTVASVLASLYPAFTVLLAATVLREHIHRVQAVGLSLAGAAVVLVALG